MDPEVISTPASAPVDVQSSNPIPDVAPAPLLSVPASSVIGLEDGETAKSVLDQSRQKILDRGPKRTELPPRKEDGTFTKPKKGAAKAPAAAPAAPAKAPEPAPAPATPAPAPAAPEVPKKFTVGGKEYTEAELQAALAPKPASAPAAPAEPAKPAPAAQAGPTPEEIQAAESKYLAELSGKVSIDIPEAKLEAILTAGPEGVAAFQSVMKEAVAKAILETRKSVYEELNPYLADLRAQIQPLAQSSIELEKVTVEQMFLAAHPEYADHIDDARYVANQLMERYPAQVQKMTREQFITEVERQTSLMKEQEFKRWYPNFAGTWKDWAKQQKAPAPAAAPAATPASPVPAPSAPSAPAKPVIRPPAGNSPGTALGVRVKDWQKSTAASLRD